MSCFTQQRLLPSAPSIRGVADFSATDCVLLYQMDLSMRRIQGVLLCTWFLPSLLLAAPMADRAELMVVYRQAVLHNSDLAAARADFAAQQEAVPQALANLLPAISAGTTIESTRLNRDQPELTRTSSGTTVQANLKQPIFNAPFWFGLKAAKASTAQAALELSAKEQALILKTVEAYFETLRATDEHAALVAEGLVSGYLRS